MELWFLLSSLWLDLDIVFEVEEKDVLAAELALDSLELEITSKVAVSMFLS